ncbi:MAG: CvfB family protein [Rickettsiales bacterium]
MLAIGNTNRLTVVKQLDFGFYLDGGVLGEILLPNRYAPSGCSAGDALDVFIYYDSEDRLIATTETPLAEVGQCAFMKVKDKGRFGVFLDWGLSKDLLVPFAEQRVPMEVGKSYVVYVFLDTTGRIAASSRLNRFLEEEDFADFDTGQEVQLLVASRSDLGVKAVIDGTHLGLIHKNDLFKPVHMGDCLTGYIKTIREDDDRIGLTLQPPGAKGRDALSEAILRHLKENGGTSALTDKSPPDAIYKAFSVSKANYKKALGRLYKEKQITIAKDKIALV